MLRFSLLTALSVLFLTNGTHGQNPLLGFMQNPQAQVAVVGTQGANALNGVASQVSGEFPLESGSPFTPHPIVL